MTKIRIVLAVVGLALAAGLAGCTSSNQEKAKQQARADLRKSGDEAKKAGHEIKEETKDLSRRVDAAVQPDSESASEKLAHAETTAENAASHAGIKLDHAALLAQVKTKLASNAGLSTLTNVDVAVNGSVVTLTGTVASEDQKRSAEMAAAQVEGVTKVRNRLTVQP